MPQPQGREGPQGRGVASGRGLGEGRGGTSWRGRGLREGRGGASGKGGGGQQWHRCRNAIKRQLARYRSEPPRNSPISSGNCLTIKFGLSHSYFAVAPVSWASARRCPPALHSGRALGEPPRPEPALKQEASRARNAAGRPAPPPGHGRRHPAFQARGPLLQWQTQPRATAGAQCPPQVQSTIKSTHSAQRTRPGRYIPTGHPAPTRRNLSPHAKCGRGKLRDHTGPAFSPCDGPVQGRLVSRFCL